MTNDRTTPAVSSQFDTIARVRARDARRHRTYYRDRETWLNNIIRPDASVLELGCGTGLTLAKLPNKRKTGIDYSPAMIDEAKTNDPTSTYECDDISSLRHRERYDYVLLLDTINFLHDIQAGLQEIRAHVCQEDSRIIVTYYNFLWQPLFLIGEWFGWKTKFPEQNWLGRQDVTNLLLLSDFDIVSHGERLLCPIGIPIIHSFLNKFLVSLPFFRMFALVKYVIARPRQHGRQERTVTVLSAVRNERGNIRPIIAAMPQMGLGTEILFIEGGSSDGTWEELTQVMGEQHQSVTVRAMQQSGRGKGAALHEGIAASTGDVLIIYDGDFTVHPSELRKVYDVLTTGRTEFVNASRLVYPLEKGAMRLLNLCGNKIFSTLFTWLFSQPLVDVLSPVKGMLRQHYASVTTRMDPFGDFDFFLGAAARQLQMREVPVHYLERSYGSTKLRPFHHGFALLKMCLAGAKRLKWM